MWFYIGVTLAVIIVVYFLFGRAPSAPKVTIRKDARLVPTAGAPKVGLKKKKTKSEEEEKVDGLKMTLFYYSQTGTAEDFARRIADDARLYGFHSKVVDVEDYDTDKFKAENHDMIVFCAATYGEGDPPENAVVFHEWLMDESLEDTLLKGSRFAVFGLGDKTYEHFNKMGKVIDKRLEALGGERVVKRGDGDSDANIEEDFLRWKKDFWTEVARVFNVTKTEGKVQRKSRAEFTSKDDPAVANVDVDRIPRWRPPAPAAAGATRRRIYDTKNPFLAKIVVNRELHSPSSDRSCRHIEIEVGDAINYEAGDHVGIFPVNDLTLVHKLAARLGADLEQVVTLYNTEDPLIKAPIIGPVTLKAALLYYYEIVLQPRKPMLRVLADYTEDEEERKKLLKLSSDDPEDQEYFQHYIQKEDRTIIEVLKDFPGVKPPIDHFLEVMPRQQPRFYSISSSPNVHKGRIHVTAVVVEYKTPCGRIHKGVCTNWLKDQIPDGDNFPVVPVFVRKSSFHLPAQLKNPIIMVGPGTGFAPFRGFLQEREYRAKKNNEELSSMTNELFFGCRRRDQDYLYKDEIEAWVENKAITTLHLAVSREGNEKVYVQHLMTKPETAQRIWDILNNNGYLYICGDAKNMSRDVQAAIRKAIVVAGGKTEAEAEKFMDNLSARGRYSADVW